MKAQIRQIGQGRHPLAVIDDFTGRADALVSAAASLRPFPAAGNYYPGLRRMIGPEDGEASAYVDFALRRIAPLLGRAFGARNFQCLEASFSMVTTPPAALDPRQRVPHVDSLDPNYIAVLHYLSDTAGTAFYRQRATGIERVSADIEPAYRAAREAEAVPEGYLVDSMAGYERIDHVEGNTDRVAIYQGALLHSGIIAADDPLHDDPLTGRLTANLFVQIE